MSNSSGCTTHSDGEPATLAPTAGRKLGSAKALRGYPKKLAVLQAKLCSLTAHAGQLVAEQQQLREREEVLYQNIQEQGEFVHNFVALLVQQQQLLGTDVHVGQCSADCSDREEQMLDALSQSAINDLRIQHALLVLNKGRAASQARGGSSGGELRTTACLRAALTAEGIAWARSVSLAQVVSLYRERIMRVSFLLAHPGKQAMLSDKLEQVVDAVIQTHMLLFAAADRLVLQLSLINCDTCQQEALPPNHSNVARALELSEEQTQHIRSAFQVYTTRRAAVIARLQPLAQQVSALLNKARCCGCSSSHAHQPSLAGAAAAAATGTTAAPSGSGSSSACARHTCAGGAGACLSLEEAEALAGLLAQYEAAVGQCRLLGRSLCWLWLNTLTPRQLAVAAVTAYPMYLQPIQICAAT